MVKKEQKISFPIMTYFKTSDKTELHEEKNFPFLNAFKMHF
jgi:hypothetical protein